MKAIQGGKGYPDLFIIEPSKDGKYHGLFLEIKTEDTTVIKRDGEFVADNHIREQAVFLYELSKRGFRAEFGVGFDKCMKIIDEYLKGGD